MLCVLFGKFFVKGEMLHLVSSLSVGKVLLSSLRTSKTFFHCTQ